MNVRHLFWAVLAAMFSVFVYSAPAQAQATRTWVSGVGDDANPCSRTAPCKTFAGAISKTAAGGEISVLDPGGFGTVTITKSISIVADGEEGGILAASTNGIIVNAASTDTVHIRGLILEGATTGLNGIRVLSAANVYVSDTVIRGFKAGTGRGFDIQSATNATRVYLRNVEVNNNLVGVYVHGGAASNTVFIERSTLEGNSSNSMVLDTATSSAGVSASFLKNPVSLTGGATFISNGNNSLGGGSAPTSTNALQ